MQWVNYTIEDPAMWCQGKKLPNCGRITIDDFPFPWASSSLLIPALDNSKSGDDSP